MVTGNGVREMARGQLLVVTGIALFLISMGTSAALAPSIGATEAEDRKTLVGVHGGGLGWHKYGRVAMYEDQSVAWRATTADSYFDVTMTDNGTVLAGFMESGRQACSPYSAPCTKTGFQRIDPDAQGGPSVVQEYSFPVRTAKNSEVHDVEGLGHGEYLLTDMERERIFVMKSGEVVWQWNASQLYDAPADPTTTDWLHINDVDAIGEGQYLISVRNANQLVIVERGSGVVEIINADTDDNNDESCAKRNQLRDTNGDGDIRCGDPTVLNHQHNPQWLGEDAVLVADSDNNRIVELHRTETGSWEPGWTLTSANGVELQWPRDADRLPSGNTLVTDTLNRRIVEVNESGSVVWSTRTEYIPYEADRLPEGEQVGAPRYEEKKVTHSRDERPVLSTLLVGIRSVWAGLPFWFREVQLLATLLSLGLVLVGSLDYWRSR